MSKQGTIPRLDFCREIGISTNTVHRWTRNGIEGVTLPAEFKGGRIYIDWDAYRDWQEQIKRKRLRLKPVPRRKTSPEAVEALRRNGYLK
jgi:hypothetical protein